MIRVIQRRLIIPRGDTGVFTIPAMTQAEGAIGVFTIFDPITNTRIFQKQVEIEGENFNISFSHADTVNLKAGDYLWDIKFYKNPILADNKVIDGEEINSYYAAFQAPKCEIRETGDDFLMIEGQPAKIEDLNIILGATEAANAAKVAATEKAEEAAAKLEEMKAAMPTKVSELENDSGYLQEETDPTVPAWAKAQTKPTYTAQEVGALPANTFIPSKVSDLTDDSGHYVKPANGIPASDLEETYLTEHQDLSNYVQKTDYATNTTVGLVKSNNAKGTQIEADGSLTIIAASSQVVKAGENKYRVIIPAAQHASVFYGLAKAAGSDEKDSELPIGQYTDSAKAAIQQMLDVPSTAAIPTKVSQLQNDSGYLTSFTETDPTVPEWAKAAIKPSYTAAEVGAPTVQEMNSAIGTAIGSVNSFDMAVVQELPTQDISTHTIYLVPKTGETNDVYDEYVYINNAWEMVGNTQIDLSNYALKSEIPDVPVQGAELNNTNIVSSTGIIEIHTGAGLKLNSAGTIIADRATATVIKEGSDGTKLISANNLDLAAFYGLATAAGDTTQSQSDNAVGTYTTEAKAAIQTMLDVPSTSDIPDVSIYATKADTVLETTLSLGRKEGTMIGDGSFAFGQDVEASNLGTFAHGYQTIASGQTAHAEGQFSVASGNFSHAEGQRTQAAGFNSHSEGVHTIANADSSHVEGEYNVADSYDNWPEWEANTAYEVGDRVKVPTVYNDSTLIIGYECKIANSDATFKKRNWNNLAYQMNYVHIIGNGTADNARSNAYALDWDGNGHYMGNIYVGANADSTGGTKVLCEADFATAQDIQNIINGGAGA